MGNQPLASTPRAIFERTERTDSCPRAVAKRPPPRRSYYTFLFATRRARGAERCGARAPTQICVRCYLSIAFSCERRETDPRISIPSSTPPSSNETRVENGIIKGWVVRTHSRRRSHVETLKLNNSRYLRSSTSSFARFGVRRVAERDFLAPPFTFRRKERASDVHALDVARREPIRAVPLE